MSHALPHRLLDVALHVLAGARHQKATVARRSREVADPSIEACAVSLASEVWDEMNRRRIGGEAWYVARERALAPRLRPWSKAYGLKCAARAHEIVLGLDPAEAPAEVRRAEAWRVTEPLVAATIARNGRLSWLDRIFLTLWGVPF